jgi:hypothetical protein
VQVRRCRAGHQDGDREAEGGDEPGLVKVVMRNVLSGYARALTAGIGWVTDAAEPVL